MKKDSLYQRPKIITLFGSGETSPHMAKSYRDIFSSHDAKLKNNYLLDTPFGFQENHSNLSLKIIDYFSSKLSLHLNNLNFSDSNSVNNFEEFKAKLINADFIFSGPGSPSYAMNLWEKHEIKKPLESSLEAGCIIAFASAAALTLGTYVIPIYEIYKVGENKNLLPGLNLLNFLNKETIVVPHFNNQEGGDHDTSHCFIGEKRFNKLLESHFRDSSKELLTIGIEEHTALIFDLNKSIINVKGNGSVFIKSINGNIEIKNGESINIRDINSSFIPSEVINHVENTANSSPKQTIELEIDSLVNLRSQARTNKNWELSDQIRDLLSQNNISISDEGGGTKWKILD